MLIDFLYSISNAQLLLIICSVSVILGALGVALTKRLMGKRMEDGTAISAMTRPIPTVFAVLAAFVAIGTLSAFHKAKDLVQKEAATISVICHEAELLPPDVASDIQGALKGYITAVISKEWPLMRMGRVDTSARAYLNVIYAHAGQYHLQTDVRRLALDKVIDHVNRLSQIHEERAYFAIESLPPVAWIVLIGCGLLTIISVSFVEMRSPMTQYACAVCVSLSVGLLVFVAFTFDNPFRGRTSVEPTPLLLQLQDMSHPAQLPPGVSAKFGS